jgi:SM-20-related protein
LFAVEHFLSSGECSEVRSAIQASTQASATVRDEHGDFVVDRRARRVQWVDVPKALTALVERRLADVRPSVARHYGVSLKDCQTPQFLAYGPGDFYKAHRDNTTDRDAATVSQERLISAVVFLNSSSPEPGDDTYGGGALTFYGLLDEPRTQSLGLPLDAEEGLLITFRSEIVHAVSSVTHGQRFTAVSWYR